MNYLSRIELSRSAVENNIKQFKSIVPKGTIILGVVKANAYGHGLKEIVTMSDSYLDGFQVDDIEELRLVRQYTKKDILVLGYVSIHDIEEAISLGAVLGCYDENIIRKINAIGKKKNKNIRIHLKIDAYIGRQGVFIEDLESILNLIERSNNIILESVYSHFSNIEDTSNLIHAHKQCEYLLKAKEIIIEKGFKNITHHISATSGILTDQKYNWGGSILRLGIGMYGLWPSKLLSKRYKNKIKLIPVLKWVTHIAQIKTAPKGYPIGYGCTYITKSKTKLALIPQGYSDGYDRGLSNNSEVIIRDTLCRVLGRIAMNMFVVDVSSIEDVKVGDEVVLIGKQRNHEMSAETLAEKIGTINYEIVARLNPLLPRIVVK